MKDKIKAKDVAGIIGKAMLRWILLCVGLGAVLRVVLLCHPLTQPSTMSVMQWIGAFAIGVVNDLCFAVIAALPLIGFWASSGHWKFRRPQCFVFLALIAAMWLWVSFGMKELWEFNKGLARVIRWVLLGWCVTFALRAFIPGLRRWWMRIFTALILFAYMAVLLMNFTGEITFWNEFGVRYNFIAVDYLVYTSEVVGNIMQSYSMGWIISAVVVASLIAEVLLFRNTIAASAYFWHPGWRLKVGIPSVVAGAAAVLVLSSTERLQHTDNVWYNELQANGAYSFVRAFSSNELDYDSFYIVCDPREARDILDAALMPDTVPDAALAVTPNIVLVTMESMSGDYMERFGNEKGLTPVLDSIWGESIAFERMFAAGNRTVRGLEALILSRPPAPGESIIKREANTGYPSVTDAIKDMGYDMKFYYGGNSYFDNMESFFTGLGYDIRDRKTMADDEITCQTVWGVCDGDIYRRVIADIDSAVGAGGSPVFAHVLTTSNHRPYIYPEGCVAISPKEQRRDGAVMYADYALGAFLREARTKPWFANTVFVVSADHCASSAGSTELPLENYHIPALIHAPGLLPPASVDVVTSQIDVFPTLFAKLGWAPAAGVYGRDVFAEGYHPRAFVATYQDMGYLADDTLTVLSPGRLCRQFVVAPTADNPYATEPAAVPAPRHAATAAALYGSK